MERATKNNWGLNHPHPQEKSGQEIEKRLDPVLPIPYSRWGIKEHSMLSFSPPLGLMVTTTP